MTPEDKAYYSDGYYPLFKLMSEEFGLTLLEQDMSEIMNCVRKMDEASRYSDIAITPTEFMDKEPPDRSKESHDDAVKRYLNHPKDETQEQRAERINRFRCGY